MNNVAMNRFEQVSCDIMGHLLGIFTGVVLRFQLGLQVELFPELKWKRMRLDLLVIDAPW